MLIEKNATKMRISYKLSSFLINLIKLKFKGSRSRRWRRLRRRKTTRRKTRRRKTSRRR